jgi:hypothetical protein
LMFVVCKLAKCHVTHVLKPTNLNDKDMFDMKLCMSNRNYPVYKVR